MDEKTYNLYDNDGKPIAVNIPFNAIVKLHGYDVEIGCKNFNLSQIMIKEPFPNSTIVQQWIDDEKKRIKEQEEFRLKYDLVKKWLLDWFFKHGKAKLTEENAKSFPFLLSLLKKNDFKINMVEIPEETFLKTLRGKLLWGEDKRN